MLSQPSSVINVEVFDFDRIEKCSKCNQTCYSGLMLELKREHILSICLCKDHALQAIQCNVVDHPSGSDFIFSQKYKSLRFELLDRLKQMQTIEPEVLANKFRQGLIQYWHDDYNNDLERELLSQKVAVVKSITDYRVPSPSASQAEVCQHSANKFEIRYFHEEYVELGEYTWVRTQKSRITFAKDMQNAIEIALLEV